MFIICSTIFRVFQSSIFLTFARQKRSLLMTIFFEVDQTRPDRCTQHNSYTIIKGRAKKESPKNPLGHG